MFDVPGVAAGRTGGRGRHAISMLSKPLSTVHSTTSSSGVLGNGAVSRPSLIAASVRPAGRPAEGRVAADVDTPAAFAGALGDRVTDEHLVVAVGERRIAGMGETDPGATPRRRPEVGTERVEEALDVTARQSRCGLAGRIPSGRGSG